MAKKWHKLVFKQIQPIHIGRGSYGVVNETRVFIPGWTMWGALTKAYNLRSGSDLSKNQDLFENISCFYPCFDREGNDILFPEFKDGEFYLGGYSEDEFRAKFVGTFVSTAVNPGTNTAMDEFLHELNMILPGAKSYYCEKDKERQLYWVGVIEFEGDLVNDLPEEVYIGGDSRYGFGKLRLVSEEKLGNSLPDNWKEKGGYITVDVDNNRNSQNQASRDERNIELLVEIVEAWKRRELNIKPMNDNGFYYVPGSKGFSVDNMGLIKGIFCKNNNGDGSVHSSKRIDI